MHSQFALDKRSKELVALIIAAHWKAEYVWWAHSLFAGEQGIAEETINAIGREREPALTSDRDRIVYLVARQLVTTGTIADDTFDECISALGEQATVELAIACGFYSMVAFVQNVASLELPANASPFWQRGGEAPVP
jgi:4-carboxymuconolactone decarboxylase